MNDNMRKVPKLPSVKRLPSYLHELLLLRENQQQVVSTTHLAQKLGLEPIIVRKDLELASAPGSPGVVYTSCFHSLRLNRETSLLRWKKTRAFTELL